MNKGIFKLPKNKFAPFYVVFLFNDCNIKKYFIELCIFFRWRFNCLFSVLILFSNLIIVREIVMVINELRNKNVVITGGSSGIGKEMAKILLENKANVAVIGRRPALLSEFAAEIESQKKKGGKLVVIQGDVSTSDGCDKIIHKLRSVFGKFDILINSAGVYYSGKFEESETAHIENMINTNIKGVINMTRLALPEMRSAKKPAVINIASIAGKVGMPYMSIYSASKFAVAGLSEALRRELNGQVRVCCVYPSGISTGFMGEAEEKLSAGAMTFDKPEVVAERILSGFMKGKDEIYIGKHTESSVFWNTVNKKTVDSSIAKMKSKLMSAASGASSEKNKVLPVDKKK